jgi:protein-S-isoprenylcysteine O-methyltransferase Ste14
MTTDVQTENPNAQGSMSQRHAYLLEFLIFVLLVPTALAAVSKLIERITGLQHWISLGHTGHTIGIIVACIGVTIWAGSPALLISEGRGAPLEGTRGPLTKGTQRLVRRGPYKYVRNPMYIGYLTLLAAIALLINSPILLLIGVPGWAIWSNHYVSHFEEKSLEERFGDEYRQYKQEVPRWIPSFRRREARTNPQ